MTPLKLFRLQYRLRTLLVFVVISACFFAWYHYKIREREKSNLRLLVGQTTSIRLPEWIRRVITDRTLVEARVNPNDLQELVITAQDVPGVAEITVVDRAGNSHRFKVTVLANQR